MHQKFCKNTIIYITIYFFLLLIHKSCSISLKQGINIASDISTRIKQIMLETTHYDKLEQLHQQLYKNDVITLKKLNVSDVSLQFRDNLHRLLRIHIDTVLDIKKKAECLHTNYTYDDKIKPFHYFNRKYQPENFVKMELTFSHSRKVNINKSYVQVPTDIHREHQTILNDARWSEPLDNVFRMNMDTIPSLLWQYFGGETGMFRSFPGKNTPWEAIDLYDCRRRLWYNQAINSPKDILIAIDLSGSMTGKHFDIAKVTIKALIDTLQQDDFFHIIYQNKKELHNVCVHFLQATSQNKETIKSIIDNLPSPSGESDIIAIFESAFEILRESYSSEKTSASCTQSIMIISDGIEHNNELAEVVENLNREGDVVIFSYIIGSGHHVNELKRLACANGGMFYRFPTVGNVWNGVLQYQKVLSKPFASSANESINFTPLYLDSGGLGMMATISAPVLSKPGNESVRKLLGVAGVDIRVTLLEMQYPITKLGVFGHAFVINNNGLFLIHPKFQDQSGYLPDPATVFLNEVEYTTNSSRSIELMAEMIDQKTGCMPLELDWLYLKNLNKRVIRLNVTYCYHPVQETPFRSGVSIPLYNQIFIDVSTRKLEQYLNSGIHGLVTSKDGKYVEIAEWLFCDIPAKEQENQPASLKFYPRAYELQTYLNGQQNYTEKCDKEMLNSLILSSAIISNFTENIWSKESLNAKEIFNVYIVTSSGYMTSLSNGNSTYQMNRDILSEEFYAHPAAFSASRNIPSIVFTVPIKEITRENNRFDDWPSVNISVGTAVYISQENVLAGITGMTLSSDFLTNLLINSSINKCMKDYCNDTFDCNHIDNYQCYLIDENGYVVTSNQGNHDNGVFFGFVNGFLMREFVRLFIYEKQIYNDTQAKCSKRIFVANSPSTRLQTLYTYIIKSVLSFPYVFIDLFTTHIRFACSEDFIVKNISCTKQIIIHTRTKFNDRYSGKVSYPSKCDQSYIFVSLEETNLALVVVSNDCLDTPADYILSNEPVQIDEYESCGRNLQYRKSLPACYKLMASNVECLMTEHEDSIPQLKSYVTISISILLLLILIFFMLCT